MYGLICCLPDKIFSLTSVSVECNIRNLLVTCSSDFIYKNNTGEDTEALFSFPLEGTCMVYHFEAVVGGKKIIGICKELEEAKNLYKAATEAGQKAAMIERNQSMADIFKCRIGNLPKDSEAKVSLKFIMELKLSLVKSESENVDRFSLCLPLILKPRYTPRDYEGDREVFEVNNKYDYKFRATLSGTKEIKNVFSNNHQLKFSQADNVTTCGQVTLESVYDGTHDLDVHIDYLKMRVPSVLYEYGTSSTKHTEPKVAGAFYQPDVAMLNFLPEFDSNSETQNKMEIMFVVDRSGSMNGSNIQHAKECLLIFLKSLPTNCKFQIYGFGSTFDKVFSQPQLYDEQSLQTAMNYQQHLEADLGGTEIMAPLKDLYSSSLPSDYTRVVFLLTDGDVGNQDEVFKLVRSHNHSTRLFTIGIGDGVSTSLVQKVAESGLGKSAFVRESKTLSASVIELLDIALNCGQLVDCKVEWNCPKEVTVVTVPSKIGSIFSNYFLTIFCMISGLKEEDTLTCNISGKINGKPMALSLDVIGKDGISDDEFRVHRLLAKYKIDEMTSEIEDGKEDQKKTLIELSLEANMVTNYTTFVAIDPEVPEKGLIMPEEPVYIESAIGYRAQSAAFDMMKSNCLSAAPPMMMAKKSRCKKSAKISCFGGAPLNCMQRKEVISDEIESSREVEDIVLYMADKQNLNGSWNINEEVLSKIGVDLSAAKASKPSSISDDIWMTIIIYLHLTEKLADREKEWRLFVKKAKQWLNETIKDSDKMDTFLKEGRRLL